MSSASATPAVTRAISKVVWPALRAHGFLDATGRTAWRRRDDTIDVVTFRAAVGSSGFPLVLGGNNYAPFGSFGVSAGTFYSVRRFLPWDLSVYARPRNPDRPEEFVCDERLHLRTSLVQPPGFPPDLWEVRTSEPEATRRAIDDALSSIERHALPWFETNTDLQAAFGRLAPLCWHRVQDSTREPDRFFAFEDLLAALAIRLGRIDEALRLFETIAARQVSSVQRAQYDAEERRRLRPTRSKRPLILEPVPFWHEGAKLRVLALQKLARAAHA